MVQLHQPAQVITPPPCRVIENITHGTKCYNVSIHFITIRCLYHIEGANPSHGNPQKTMELMIMNPDIIGNITTIIKIIIMTIAPAIAVYIGVTPDVVITFLTAVLTFILALYDAKYPNTLKAFNNQEIAEHSQGLNDEYDTP